jgi:hypothetical protein
MLGCFYYHIFNYTTISEYGKDFLKTEKNMVIMDGNGNNLTYIDIFLVPVNVYTINCMFATL